MDTMKAKTRKPLGQFLNDNSSVIAVLLLIFLIYKRLSLIPATLICVAVLALTNGFSYMDLFINHYGVSLAGFVGKYFLPQTHRLTWLRVSL